MALHVFLFVVLPLILVLYAFATQNLWSLVLSPPSRGIEGLLWADVVQPLPLQYAGGSYSLPLFQACWVEAAVFVSMAFVRLLCQYFRSKVAAKMSIMPFVTM